MRIIRSSCVLALFSGWLLAADAPILTPKPGNAPEIHGPKIYGVRPGHAFLYRIPCTGKRPVTFSAEGLPGWLHVDSETGIITGTAQQKPGEFKATLIASSSSGKSRRPFRIVVGDKLALTPPMGWNDWYTHYDRITDAHMRRAADAMLASGMADYGYQYVNIDDCWMAKPDEPRDAAGAVRPNAKFPDMKALADYIHSRGLKAGLYTSPGPRTCAGYAGSYQHEAADAHRFAEWGFDFLKYDWCSYTDVAGGKTLAHRKRPYALMGGLLKELDRDVVFNLCQYGEGSVWTWGAEIGGHSWRTTDDLGVAKDTGLPGFYSIAFQNADHWEYAGPGHWNDPDYILIGTVGNANSMSDAPKLTGLTPDEQYSYMSMWALMAAPLFYSGDMDHLDPFTLNVLCNDEVIDIDQDPLGKQARPVRRTAEEFVLAKPLEDGSVAVGFFNLTKETRTISASWPEVGAQKPSVVRDLWRQKSGKVAAGSYTATVNPHGVVFVRLIPAD